MVTWEELEALCQRCQNCPLGETRTKLVFGVGNRQADVMLIGEGPGEQEDLQGNHLLVQRESCWISCSPLSIYPGSGCTLPTL